MLRLSLAVVSGGLLSSCGAWAQSLCDMWNPPGPGIEPVSPALAGGFLSTVPPGKSSLPCFKPPSLLSFVRAALIN